MELFEKALCFAAEKHSGQRRKRASTLYIFHPMEAALIVSTMTSDQNVLAAAVLHDTIEDAGVTAEEIEKEFGARVKELVLSETENKRSDLPAEDTWFIRKQESLEELKNSQDVAVKMLWLGDKLSNARSYYREYLKSGDALWNNFHEKDPKKQAWYYRTVAECVSDLSEYDAYKEYVRLIDKVFENVSR